MSKILWKGLAIRGNTHQLLERIDLAVHLEDRHGCAEPFVVIVRELPQEGVGFGKWSVHTMSGETEQIETHGVVGCIGVASSCNPRPERARRRGGGGGGHTLTPGSVAESLSELGVHSIWEPSSKKYAGETVLNAFFWMSLTLRNLPVLSSLRSEKSTCGCGEG